MKEPNINITISGFKITNITTTTRKKVSSFTLAADYAYSKNR